MINQNLLLTGDDGYNLTNSLRFRSSASAYLNRTFSSPTDAKKWTYSIWVKRSILNADQILLMCGTSGNDRTQIQLNSDSTLSFVNAVSGVANIVKTTTQVFRDPSAWYHFVIYFDSTPATPVQKIYCNGTEITAFSTNTNTIAQNGTTYIDSNAAHFISKLSYASSTYFDGYLAEVNFIDGQALTPSSFGQTSATTGVWQPIKYTGTYGTNGFYLPFTDNSALTTSSNVGLGKDFSGNSNYWTTNNISLTTGSTYDSMTDVPTLTSATVANYAVMNPLNSSSSMTPSSGNLNVITSGVSVSSVSTIAVNSGKWYCEITIANVQDSTILGIAPSDRSYLSGGFYSVTGSVGYYQDGTKFISGSQTSYGASYTTNDVIGIALDMDAGTVTFYKNNTSQGTAASGLTGGYYFAVGDASSGSNTSYNVNLGQRPFAYTPPTGFKALNTFNLPTPTIGATASTTANKYFNSVIWTGDQTNKQIPLNFTADFVWAKRRDSGDSHRLYDVIRGINKDLQSNATDPEQTNDFGLDFDNGNYLAIDGTKYFGGGGGSGITFVAWNWKANGAGVTNTAGSITSTVSANTSAGFSIVTYTGNGTSGATVGHGLGVAPSMYIVKSRSAANNWCAYHVSLGNQYATLLNSTAGSYSNSNYWNNTSPTSTVFSLGNGGDTNQSSATFVAYCFAQIAGYSAFGSYTGNGSSDGTFVYTGFRPRYVMFKRTDTTANWTIRDTARNPYNSAGLGLFPNLSAAEDSTAGRDVDILSNGFKIRGTDSDLNTNNGTYIYAAFCESPFKYANAR